MERSNIIKGRYCRRKNYYCEYFLKKNRHTITYQLYGCLINLTTGGFYKIRPILRGRGIKRYGYEWAGLWIINTHNGIKGKLPRIDVNEYPAIKAHLDQYWDKISNRADKGDTPYNLRNCAYMEDFSKQQIVWIELSDNPKFALTQNMVSVNTVFFLTGEHIPHLLGLLNSKLITWYFHHCIGTTSRGGTNRWLKYTIEQIPMAKF